MRKLLALVVFALCGCATIDRENYATLLFDQPPIMGMPGGILGIGKATDFSGAKSMRVEPGVRTVYYRCPGTITMDEQPHLRVKFEQAETYLLECQDSEAVVRKQTLPN